MATAAFRDRMVDSGVKKLHKLDEQRDRLTAKLVTEQQKVNALEAETNAKLADIAAEEQAVQERIDWMHAMPVEDEPDEAEPGESADA